MKKLASLFVVLCLLLSTKLFAQTSAEALWNLASQSGATVTGHIIADTVYSTPPLLQAFKVGTASGPALFVKDSAAWAANEPGPDFARYIQYLVKPAPDSMLHVDSVAFWLACSGTHGYMHAAVYWDTDTAGFSYNNQLLYDSATGGNWGQGLPDVRDEANGYVHDTSFAINTNVNNGGLFALRIVPWYNYKSASTGKYIVMWLVRIYGTTSAVTGIKSEPGLPTQYSLHQNYPNPFNPSTTISFDLPKSNLVTLNVYNLLGQKVATLLNENMSAGTHSVNFNADKLPSGLYFYQLQSGSFNSVKKMMLLK